MLVGLPKGRRRRGRRARARFAPAAFDGGNQRGFSPQTKRAGAALDDGFQKLNGLPRMFCPSKPKSMACAMAICRRPMSQRIFLAAINKTFAGAHGIGGQSSIPSNQAVRIAFQDGAVHERARVAFVGIAKLVYLISPGDLRHSFPFDAGGKSRAAAAAQARFLTSRMTSSGGQLGEHLAERAGNRRGRGRSPRCFRDQISPQLRRRCGVVCG